MVQDYRVILITGASGGIGRACAIALSHALPSSEAPEPLVLVLSGRKIAQIRQTANQLREGTVVELVVGDATSERDVCKMFDLVKEKYGRLDMLFNNAGVDLLNSVPLEDAEMAIFRQVLDVNIMAAVLCTREAIKIMKNQTPQGGRIVNNGSISAMSPRPDSTAYTVSKHAILGLSKSTSLDGRKYHICCTQLDIGNAQTALGGHASKGCKQADGSMKSEPMMDVENVGRTLAYLATLPLGADVQKLIIL
nr:short-chain dehydrogenase/reductase SDR [Kwoniella dejecticola CBS 10117]OBR83384.1 short-chain dehydrogenase/reductase SDR [Kwoniella dejecticola CBS 10117]